MENRKFTVDTGVVHITDPCYTRDITHNNWNIPAKPGQWVTTIVKSGNRPARLMACHETYGYLLSCIEDTPSFRWQLLPYGVGVDSGQFGIFSDSIYPISTESTGEYEEKDSFYMLCCDATCETPDSWGVIMNGGVVSGTNGGDGEYPAYVKHEDGLVVAILLDSVSSFNEEEDGW
jgi:hypothetical protein